MPKSANLAEHFDSLSKPARKSAKPRRAKDAWKRVVSGNDKSPNNTKDLILRKALTEVSRHGLAGLTIGELAKAVGMSKSGLFAHFGGKDQLQLAVLELAVTRFVEIVLRPAFSQARGEPRIVAVCENWLDHLNSDHLMPAGSVLIAASTELDDRPGRLRDFVQKSQRALIASIERATEMAIAEGHFRKNLNVQQFAWSLYSFVLGFHHFSRMLEDPKAETHFRNSFMTLLEVARRDGPSQRTTPKARERQAKLKTKKKGR